MATGARCTVCQSGRVNVTLRPLVFSFSEGQWSMGIMVSSFKVHLVSEIPPKVPRASPLGKAEPDSLDGIVLRQEAGSGTWLDQQVSRYSALSLVSRHCSLLP